MFAINLDGISYDVEILALAPHLTLRIAGCDYEVKSTEGEADGRQTLHIDGKAYSFARAHVGARQIVRLAGRTFEARLIDPREAAEATGGGHDHVRAPMPGSVVDINKRPGDAVLRGEALLTIESMKMQITLVAPRDGVLAALKRGVGETFDKDEIVAELAPLEAGGV